jgi:hypothetical protein
MSGDESDAQQEVSRYRKASDYAEHLATFYEVDGEERASFVRDIVDKTLNDPDSIDWDELRDRAHARQMEARFGDLYREWREMLEEIRADSDNTSM